MTDKLNEQVSALLDNELPDHEAASVLDRLNQDHELRQRWERYHMIGDVMRGEAISLRSKEISERVRQQIDIEPAIICIPKKGRTAGWNPSWIKPLAGAALAASVATVVVISAPAFLGLDEATQPVTAANISNTPTAPIVTAANISNLSPAATASAIPVAHTTIPETRWKNLKEPSLESRLNNYLVDHSEYASPGTGMGVMPYATFVGYDSNNIKSKP